MTQKDRVLKSLRVAGSRGITQADWTGAYAQTPDGGAPITRLAARVLDLKQQGYTIKNGPLRDSCRVYSLIPTEPISAPLAPLVLLPEAERRITNHYEWEAAA